MNASDILKASILFTILSFLQPLSSFVLLPLYLNVFTVEEYGAFSLFNVISIFLGILGGFGIANGVPTFYSNFKNSRVSRLLNYKGSILTFSLVSNALVFLLFLFAGKYLFNLLFKSTLDFYWDGVLSIFIGLGTSTIAVYLAMLRFDGTLKVYALISITVFVASLLGQYAWLNYSELGITGGLLGRAGSVMLGVCLIIFINLNILFKGIKSLAYSLPTFKFGFAILPSTLLLWIYGYLDRFIIESYLDLANLGQFSFMMTIASTVEIFFLAIGHAIQPGVFNAFHDNKEGKPNLSLNSSLNFYLTLTILFGAFVFILGQNLSFFVNKPEFLYVGNWLVYPVIGFIVASYHFFLNFHCIYHKKSKFLFLASALMTIVSVTLNFILIPLFSLYGAIAAHLLSRLIMLPFTYWVAKTSSPIMFSKNIAFYRPGFLVIIILLFHFLIQFEVLPPQSGSFLLIGALLLVLVVQKNSIIYIPLNLALGFFKKILKVN
jgi:O-antigen/teichoic acid export membrane protein